MTRLDHELQGLVDFFIVPYSPCPWPNCWKLADVSLPLPLSASFLNFLTDTGRSLLHHECVEQARLWRLRSCIMYQGNWWSYENVGAKRSMNMNASRDQRDRTLSNHNISPDASSELCLQSNSLAVASDVALASHEGKARQNGCRSPCIDRSQRVFIIGAARHRASSAE